MASASSTSHLEESDRAKREVSEVLERLRKLSRAVEQSPVSVIITDTDGSIEYVNPKFTQVTGYSSDEVLGMNPRILKSGELSREVYREMWKTITDHRWPGVARRIPQPEERRRALLGVRLDLADLR